MHLLHPERGFRSGLLCVLFRFFEIKSQITAFYSVIYMWEVKSVTGIQGPDSAKRERLTVLIRQYEKDILRICYLYLRETELAKDAVQDTFLKAYTHLDDLHDQAKAKAWLARIAVNICRDHLRSPWVTHMNRYVQPEDLRIPAEQPDETNAALTQAVLNLPRKHREAVTLRYVQGYDIQETAEILGITPSAVSRRCRRACIRLRNELEGSNDHNG